MISTSEINSRISLMLQGYKTREKELLSSCSRKVESYIQKNIGIFQKIEKTSQIEELRTLVAAAEDGLLESFAKGHHICEKIFLEHFKSLEKKSLGWKEKLKLGIALLGKKKFFFFGKKTDSYYTTLAKRAGKFALEFFQTLDMTSWRAVCKPRHIKYDERAGGYLLHRKKVPQYLVKGMYYIPPGRPALNGAKPEEIIWISSQDVPESVRKALGSTKVR